MPSIRVTSRCHSVSTGTVLQAYQQLEAQGWIVAKPQSGYFVTAKLERVEELRQSDSFTYPSLNDRLFEFLKSHNQEHHLKLGSAFPEPICFLWRHLTAA
ncbi:transcriptional regulator GntR family domain [Vibrio ponticus]|nr:transcriptional regulator GntR family domain [Vibrio ponticus]